MTPPCPRPLLPPIKNNELNINVSRWFIIFCLLHLCLWTVVPTLFRATIPFDTAEGFAWGLQWQWGYDKHPPLAPWLTALFAYWTGVGFTTYLLSQLSVMIALICIFKLAKQIMTPIYALVSVFLFEGLDFYTIASPKFDPDVLSLATWALSILWFYQAIKNQQTFRWMLFGFAAGLAMLTKYTAVLLFISMLIVLITSQEGRQSFKRPGIYIAGNIFLLMLLPNLLWLIKHDFISITYAMERGASHAYPYSILNHILHPLRFIFEETSRFLPIVLLLIPFYFAAREKHLTNNFEQKFLCILLFGPFIIAIILAVLIGTNLHAGWAYPFFTLSTASLIYFLQPQIKLRKFKQFIFLVAFIGLGLPLMQVLVMNLQPYYQCKTDRALFPMQEVTRVVTKSWEEQYYRPLKYVAGSRYLTAFIAAYSSQHPKPYYEWNKQNSPWIDEDAIKKYGAVFVWWIEDVSNQKLPPTIVARFPRVQKMQIQSFAMLTKAKVADLKIGLAFLPPESLSPLPSEREDRHKSATKTIL